MDLFVQEELNLALFDLELRQGTDNFNKLIYEAIETRSPQIEVTHFLIVLSQLPGGMVGRFLLNHNFTLKQWCSGLSVCTSKAVNLVPFEKLMRTCFADDAVNMLQQAIVHRQKFNQKQISEGILFLSALKQASQKVHERLKKADIDLDEWCDEIEQMLTPVTPIQVFADQKPYALIIDAFLPKARKALKLLQSECEALGYQVADSRHLLLALVVNEGGFLPYALHRQGVLARHVQEAVMLQLVRTQRLSRSQCRLDKDHMHALLQRILILAGDSAAQERQAGISERELVQALLSVDTMAQGLLEDEGVQLSALHKLTDMSTRYEEDQPEEDTVESWDLPKIRNYLDSRLVGQDQAIEQILPYVQRARFGFFIPNSPMGVFLFAGPSGSGKTEMAKALAKAVYGSEDDLIYIEMGQFNTKESINNFIGAPPGYIGYGEGKLTNGLRDKPNSVVLFDEIEKAESKVLDALLRFLDEGKITDPAGPVRDGSGCILVLTSNVGAQALNAFWQEINGDANWKMSVRKKLRNLFEQKKFRVEFLNRVNELILFRRLSTRDYSEITRRILAEHLERLKKEHQVIVILDNVCEAIGIFCEAVDEGARNAHRLAMSVVITPVIDYLMREHLTPPVQLHVRAHCECPGRDCEPRGIVSLVE